MGKKKTRAKFPGSIYIYRHPYNGQLIASENLDQVNDGTAVATYKLVTTQTLTKVLK